MMVSSTLNTAAKVCLVPKNKTENKNNVYSSKGPPISKWRETMPLKEQKQLKLRPVVVIFEPGNGFKAVDAPKQAKDDYDRTQALLNFSKSFKKVKRAKSAAVNRKRRRKRKKKLRKCQSEPNLRPKVAELMYAFVNNVDVQKSELNIPEDEGRRRSSSLIPYSEGHIPNKLPNKRELIKDFKKVALRSFYVKKVWKAMFPIGQ